MLNIFPWINKYENKLQNRTEKMRKKRNDIAHNCIRKREDENTIGDSNVIPYFVVSSLQIWDRDALDWITISLR